MNEYCDDGLWVVPICEFIHNIDKREADSIDDVMRKDLPEIQRILNQVGIFENLEKVLNFRLIEKNFYSHSYQPDSKCSGN